MLFPIKATEINWMYAMIANSCRLQHWIVYLWIVNNFLEMWTLKAFGRGRREKLFWVDIDDDVWLSGEKAASWISIRTAIAQNVHPVLFYLKTVNVSIIKFYGEGTWNYILENLNYWLKYAPWWIRFTENFRYILWFQMFVDNCVFIEQD